jgi:hypothetical protein
MMKSDPL